MNEEKELILNYNKEIKDEINGIISKLENADLSENKEISDNIRELVSQITEQNKKFQEVIKDIEDNSEFEKLCISFFGNTNAGKSTIIESLRIIFDEQQKKSIFFQKLQGILDYSEKNIAVNESILNDINEIRQSYKKKRALKSLLIVACICFVFILGILIGKNI